MKPELSVVGIDLAKSVFHLVGMDKRGKIILRKRLERGEVMPFLAKLPRVLGGMGACGGAHYWVRQLREQGHEVKLMAPQYGCREPFVHYFRWRVSDASLRRSRCSLSDKAGTALIAKI
jgi:transposase